MHLLYVCTVFALGILGAFGCVIGAWRRWGKGTRAAERMVNAAVLFTTLLLLGVLAECYYYLFPQTDGFGFTKSDQRWRELHWSQHNGLGYRDVPFYADSRDSEHLIVALGDSFTAGSGVKHVSDRFSNELEAELGAPWRVANVAQPGWDTAEELTALQALPVEPRMVLLAYFPNDIEHAVLASGGSMLPPIQPPPRMLEPLVNQSYAINHWYWRLYRMLQPRMTQHAYAMRLRTYYEDAALWEVHRAKLLELVSYTRSREISLLVVYLPHVVTMEENPPIAEKMLSAVEEAGAEVLDLTPVLAGRETASLVVNAFDGHYNREIHRELGALLAQVIVERGMLEERGSISSPD
ncbi:MAG: SGNH/GDSL hydrolase family protein [bacterium]|nr:SGNH/GDSL hydrolase family protein [bacterium]